MPNSLAHILLFHAEDDLTGDNAFIWIFEVQITVKGKTGRVFENMRCDWSILDCVRHCTCLPKYRNISNAPRTGENAFTFLVNS